MFVVVALALACPVFLYGKVQRNRNPEVKDSLEE